LSPANLGQAAQALNIGFGHPRSTGEGARGLAH
jgi:hypothetical protein